MTVIGTAGAVLGSLWFFPTGHILAGTFVVWGFAMLDLLDGAMARATRRRTPGSAPCWTPTCDRIADGALMAGHRLVVLRRRGDRLPRPRRRWCVWCSAQVISYIKARAEAPGSRRTSGWSSGPSG